MKKNMFYLLVGCVALALLLIFWYSLELHISIFIELAFIVGIILIIAAKTRVSDRIDDERDIKITEQATARTMQIFWIIFALFSIGAVMELLHVPEFPRLPPSMHTPVILPPRLMGYIQLGLLCLMIFLYVGFRIYYAKKYGEFETDEE
jgi:uncharacterized membrane protein